MASEEENESKRHQYRLDSTTAHMARHMDAREDAFAT